MAGTEKGLKGLKPYAEASLFNDLRVTPELKEKLKRRIKQGENRKAAPARNPWLTRSAVAVAAAAVIVMVGQTSLPSTPDQASNGASAKAEAPVGRPAEAPAPATPAPPRADGSYSGSTTGAPGKVTVRDAQGKASGNALQYSRGEASTGVQGVEAQPGRKIVLNADYALQVKDARAAVEELQRLAQASGGYVVEANLNKADDGSWYGRLVLRIPSGQYTGAIQQVRQVGEVKQERQWSQDVTAQYMDLESRTRILKEHEVKLKELAARAATFDDWLRLTNQINETRAQIENMEGSLKLLANQVEYSTLVVSLMQPAPGKGSTPPASDPGLWSEMIKSFDGSIRWLINQGRSFLVGLAALAPFLVPAAVLGGIAAAALRRRRQRRDEP